MQILRHAAKGRPSVANHRWSLLCRHAVIDKYSNLLSLLDVVDEAEAEEPPKDISPEDVGVGINAQLVSMWVRSDLNSPETFWQGVTITTPNGKTHDTNARIEGDLRSHPRTRLIIGIKALPFGGFGQYLFNIHYSTTQKRAGKIVASVPIQVKLKEGETTPPT